jgi:hypothetical protein
MAYGLNVVTIGVDHEGLPQRQYAYRIQALWSMLSINEEIPLKCLSLQGYIPWLYLRGISTGNMQPALASLLGKQAKGLPANTISRLKLQWEQEYDLWRKRNLSKRCYVYLWADCIKANKKGDSKI